MDRSGGDFEGAYYTGGRSRAWRADVGQIRALGGTLDLQGQMAQKANVIAGGGPTPALKPGRNRALPPSGVASAGNSSSPSSVASESPP